MKKRKQATSHLARPASLSLLMAGLLSSMNISANDADSMIAELGKRLAPASPMKPSEENIDQAVAAREGFGFRSDREYVKDILINPARHGALSGPLTGGHYATPEEVEALKIRLLLQEDAIALKPRLQEDPDFAGIFISKKNVIHIGYTVDAVKRVEALRKELRLPDRLQAFMAERSLQELENSKDRISGMQESLAAEGILVSRVVMDVEKNRVQVGIVDLDPRKIDIIAKLFGDVDVIDKPLNEVENRSDTADPMRAGVRITNATGGSCTSNWKARDRTTGEFVSITAGHCVADVDGTLGGAGAAFFQGNSGGFPRQIGVSDQTTWLFPMINVVTGARSGSGEVDALRAPFDSGIFSMPWLYAYDSGNAGVFTDSEAVRIGAVNGTVVIGTGVCSGGQFSPGNQVGGSNWKNCGTVNAVNVANTFIRQPGSPDRFTVLNSNEATYTAIGGDSGSPTWRVGHSAAKGWHAIAVGHHSGGPAGGEIFNDIDRVENALNVDIRFY